MSCVVRQTITYTGTITRLWSRGMMVASHATDSGSSPGGRNCCFLLLFPSEGSRLESACISAQMPSSFIVLYSLCICLCTCLATAPHPPPSRTPTLTPPACSLLLSSPGLRELSSAPLAAPCCRLVPPLLLLCLLLRPAGSRMPAAPPPPGPQGSSAAGVQAGAAAPASARSAAPPWLQPRRLQQEASVHRGQSGGQ